MFHIILFERGMGEEMQFAIQIHRARADEQVSPDATLEGSDCGLDILPPICLCVDDRIERRSLQLGIEVVAVIAVSLNVAHLIPPFGLSVPSREYRHVIALI